MIKAPLVQRPLHLVTYLYSHNTIYHHRFTSNTFIGKYTLYVFVILVFLSNGIVLNGQGSPCLVSGGSNHTVCINATLPPFGHSTTGIDAVLSIAGLPGGVTPTLTGNSLTFQGIPTQSGTFNYNIVLSGGLCFANAMGTITVQAIPCDSVYYNGHYYSTVATALNMNPSSGSVLTITTTMTENSIFSIPSGVQLIINSGVIFKSNGIVTNSGIITNNGTFINNGIYKGIGTLQGSINNTGIFTPGN